jgi:hypothetical protein
LETVESSLTHSTPIPGHLPSSGTLNQARAIG